MRRKEHVAGKKHCSLCDRWQPLTAYHANKINWDNLNAHCKDCMRESHNKRYAKDGERMRKVSADYRSRNPEKRKELALKVKFGITLEFFKLLVAEQEGRCAICGRGDMTLHVDHCHKSGSVRGLLCMPCNTAIGQLGDDPERIRKAALYVESAQ